MYNSLIGKSLEQAIAIIGEDNYTVIHNDSDKLKTWDSELVVRCNHSNGSTCIVLSHFKLMPNQ